jgi:putative membrane protein
VARSSACLRDLAARALTRAALRPLLIAAGIGVIAFLVVQAGPATIWDAFRTLSWRLLLVMVFPIVLVILVDTLGWRFTFPTPPRSFARLLGARLAGEAVNLGTPTASVGGEPVKAYLLRPEISLRDGLASVVVDKTTGVVSQVLMLLAGLLVGAAFLSVASPLALGMSVALAVQVLCVMGFVIVQLRGAIGGGGRLLARLRMPPSRERQATLDGLDRALRAIYVDNSRGLFASMACHFMGFTLGTLEIYLVVQLLGLPISLATAFTIGAFGTAVKFFSFMVPASLGALEGGNVALFLAFGLPGPVGLTYTLVRRLREIAWIAVGFLALNVLSTRN